MTKDAALLERTAGQLISLSLSTEYAWIMARADPNMDYQPPLVGGLDWQVGG